MDWPSINRKLPEVIDLFSGCGGLGFGFRSAGFCIGGGMDLSPAAVSTAAYNLGWRFGEEDQHLSGDITQCDASTFKSDSARNGYIVIGGPPCQAYSQIGRGKLRSLGKDREYLNDSRGQLYHDFIRLALDLDARAVVMENVPEAINYGGQNIPEKVCSILEDNGYAARWSILNAADFGVPQTRERMFVIAVKKSENVLPTFPTPTHTSIEGKANSYRQRVQKLSENRHFSPPLEAMDHALPWVTVSDAISDLPILFPSSKSRYRLYESNILLKYAKSPTNDYQRLMREWAGSAIDQVSGHGFRRTIRDYAIFEHMKPEDNFIHASEIAESLLERACGTEGISEYVNPERYNSLRKKIVPPYNREKFHDKWKRLSPNKPSHTVVAHLSVDTYSHIHPWEPRGISVREAARLQSFPDNFLFQCPMGDAFRQIGNAVPPLLANALARNLAETFNK